MNKNILIVILAGIVGGILGTWFSRRNENLDSRIRGNDKDIINPEQQEKKRQNLEKILDLAKSSGQIRNDEVQTALGVSDATATRYLEELEKQGKLEQIGDRGHQVIYRLK